MSEQQETAASSSGKMKAPKNGGTKKSKKRKINDDKQVVVYGGIYEDMNNFDKLYPEASATFKRNLVDLKIIPYEPPKRSY